MKSHYAKRHSGFFIINKNKIRRVKPMIINFQDNPEDNEMLNEIKRKLGKEY